MGETFTSEPRKGQIQVIEYRVVGFQRIGKEKPQERSTVTSNLETAQKLASNWQKAGFETVSIQTREVTEWTALD